MFRSPLAAVLGAVFVTQLALFVTTIWLHRALSHRAMTVTPGVTRVFRIVTWITTGIRPDGTRLSRTMPYEWYHRITSTDLDALVAFLRTVKPLKTLH